MLTQSVCHLGTLQDGKHSSSRASVPGGGLDGKSRSQGCIFLVPIHRDHQQWLSFHWQDQDYQFCCLLFSLCSAPLVFTKITHPIVAWLRQLGVRLIAYINDFLLLAPSKEEAHIQTQLMTTVLQALGFLINNKKYILVPCQEIIFLAVIV